MTAMARHALQARLAAAAHQRGSAIVEFALILPLLISILAAIIEFGCAFWYYDALAKATAAAAREMSVSAKASIASLGVPNARKQVVDAVAAAGVPDFASTNVDIACLASDFSDAPCTDGAAPSAVRIRIIDYRISIGQILPLLLGATSSDGATLSPQTTMRYMLQP
jgi:Flp pilus assembly protein TadG